jgi:hypothetical protein
MDCFPSLGRFAGYAQHRGALVENPAVDASTKIALRAIAIAISWP